MDRLLLRLRGASSTVDDDCDPLLAVSDGMYLVLLFMAPVLGALRVAWSTVLCVW